MHVEKLTATNGIVWIQSGWRLFRLQPINFVTLLASYIFAIMATGLIAEVIGQLIARSSTDLPAQAIVEFGYFAILVLVPGLSIGFLEASRTALDGAPVYPTVFLRAFRRSRRTTFALLVIGVIEMGTVLLILHSLAEPTLPPEAIDKLGNLDINKLAPEKAIDYLSQSVLRNLATLPVFLALWYAPVLVAWHDMSVFKSIFFSVAAVWRNRWVFLVYLCGWAFALIFIACSVATILTLIGQANLGLFLIVPLLLMMSAVLYCSVYPSYRTVFVEDPPAATPTEP